MSDNFKDIWDMRNRGARDSVRHKERVKKAIKDNLHDLIAQENIISSKNGKKIKIPMRYLDMYRFKFGKNDKQQGVGQGEGEAGDTIAKENGKEQGKGDKAGDQEGEDIYEEMVDVDEIIEMMLEDLDLPWLEEKENTVEIETEKTIFQDIADKGLPNNIDKKQTVFENMKRNAMKGKMRIGGFEQSDMKYRVWEQVVEQHSNAAVILSMDRSGSMTTEKKYIVKSFFFWMVQFLKRKYNNVEIVFIAHDTKAREVEEDNFFTIADSGGTYISSGLYLAKDIIQERYDPSTWNNYVFAFSDGDNWSEDNKRCIEVTKELLDVCQSVGYGEVEYSDYFYGWGKNSGYRMSNMATIYQEDDELRDHDRFVVASIEKKEDVYKCLKEFLGGIDNKGK